MTETTFVLGSVLALILAVGLGAVLTVLWMRTRDASLGARSAAEEARSAADASRPLADTLARIEKQMREFESQRQHAQGGLETHLASLSKETVALGQALRGPNSRGRWGELTLRRVAELAGMSPHCDFVEQESRGTGGGNDAERRRPDMIVKLPGGRHLAVDAKAPLSAYLDAESASDPQSRQEALDRHAQQLSRHVAELSGRQYWAQLDPAPELVVLFLPGEHFLGAALERRRDLLDHALAKKVLIATPVTLVSILKGVGYGWRQEQLARNAEELRRVAGDFQERVRVFADYFSDTGKQLGRAVDSYNRSVASWDSRLLPSLKRMEELGSGSGRAAPEPARIDTVPKRPRPVAVDVAGESRIEEAPHQEAVGETPIAAKRLTRAAGQLDLLRTVDRGHAPERASDSGGDAAPNGQAVDRPL